MLDIVNVMFTGTVILSPTRVKAANLKPGDVINHFAELHQAIEVSIAAT